MRKLLMAALLLTNAAASGQTLTPPNAADLPVDINRTAQESGVSAADQITSVRNLLLADLLRTRHCPQLPNVPNIDGLKARFHFKTGAAYAGYFDAIAQKTLDEYGPRADCGHINSVIEKSISKIETFDNITIEQNAQPINKEMMSIVQATGRFYASLDSPPQIQFQRGQSLFVHFTKGMWARVTAEANPGVRYWVPQGNLEEPNCKGLHHAEKISCPDWVRKNLEREENENREFQRAREEAQRRTIPPLESVRPSPSARSEATAEIPKAPAPDASYVGASLIEIEGYEGLWSRSKIEEIRGYIENGNDRSYFQYSRAVGDRSLDALDGWDGSPFTQAQNLAQHRLNFRRWAIEHGMRGKFNLETERTVLQTWADQLFLPKVYQDGRVQRDSRSIQLSLALRAESLNRFWTVNVPTIAEYERALAQSQRKNSQTGEDTLRIQARGGHFQTDISLNGVVVAGILDTGASDVSIRRSDAARAGVRGTGVKQTYESANGPVEAERCEIAELRIGPIALNRVACSIRDDGPTLFGMSMIRRLKSFEISGDQLILRN